MAKSVGNIALLSDALDEYGRDALVMYVLSGHYRQPLAFSSESLEQARRSVERIANFCRLVRRAGEERTGDEPGAVVTRARERFFSALREDFNTPQALAELFELVAEGNRRLERDEAMPGVSAALAERLEVIGLERLLAQDEAVDEEALRLAAEREEARRARDYPRADRARNELRERGYEIRDTPEGPVLVPTRRT